MMFKNMRKKTSVAMLGVVLATGLSACSTGSESAQTKLEIVSNFYPVKYLVDQIGGDLIENSSLTPDGAEPHDLILNPKSIVKITEADLARIVKRVVKEQENTDGESNDQQMSGDINKVIIDKKSGNKILSKNI